MAREGGPVIRASMVSVGAWEERRRFCRLTKAKFPMQVVVQSRQAVRLERSIDSPAISLCFRRSTEYQSALRVMSVVEAY